MDDIRTGRSSLFSSCRELLGSGTGRREIFLPFVQKYLIPHFVLPLLHYSKILDDAGDREGHSIPPTPPNPHHQLIVTSINNIYIISF